MDSKQWNNRTIVLRCCVSSTLVRYGVEVVPARTKLAWTFDGTTSHDDSLIRDFPGFCRITTAVVMEIQVLTILPIISVLSVSTPVGVPDQMFLVRK